MKRMRVGPFVVEVISRIQQYGFDDSSFLLVDGEEHTCQGPTVGTE